MRRLIVAEPVARLAVWARRLAIFALATVLVALALARSRAADPGPALAVFAASLGMAVLAGLLAAAAAAVVWRDGLRGAGQAAFALGLAAAILAYPAYLAAVAFALPPIHDVSTDLEVAAHLPAFRQGARGPSGPCASAFERGDARGAAGRLSRHRPHPGRNGFDRCV